MNILVLGATGTIGTLLTQRLHDDGHAVTAWSRRTHGDLSTQLIPLDMVEGTELIIDVTDAKRRSSMLPTMAANVVSSVHRAAVTPRILCLGILNQDKSTFSYYKHKQQQHQVYASSGLPYTAVRCTQFTTFLTSLFDAATPTGLIPLPTGTRWQLIDPRDVATQLASPPQSDVLTLAGPETLTSREAAERYRTAHGSKRILVNLRVPGAFGKFLREGLNLTTEPDAMGTLTYQGR